MPVVTSAPSPANSVSANSLMRGTHRATPGVGDACSTNDIDETQPAQARDRGLVFAAPPTRSIRSVQISFTAVARCYTLIMANGVPVRLSARLAQSARTAADVQDRSVTEQVEHWARLGQVVEAAISAGATHRLKVQSHDPELANRL